MHSGFGGHNAIGLLIHTYFDYLFFRPPELGGPPPGKAVLSMNCLSFSVIRVDTEEKLSVLTVQDVGQIMPGGRKVFLVGVRILHIRYLYYHICAVEIEVLNDKYL